MNVVCSKLGWLVLLVIGSSPSIVSILCVCV